MIYKIYKIKYFLNFYPVNLVNPVYNLFFFFADLQKDALRLARE